MRAYLHHTFCANLLMKVTRIVQQIIFVTIPQRKIPAKINANPSIVLPMLPVRTTLTKTVKTENACVKRILASSKNA